MKNKEEWSGCSRPRLDLSEPAGPKRSLGDLTWKRTAKRYSPVTQHYPNQVDRLLASIFPMVRNIAVKLQGVARL